MMDNGFYVGVTSKLTNRIDKPRAQLFLAALWLVCTAVGRITATGPSDNVSYVRLLFVCRSIYVPPNAMGTDNIAFGAEADMWDVKDPTLSKQSAHS
jgi:hypothetical protein